MVEAVTAFVSDHDMTAPLNGRARQRIVWGGVDPGSARLGVAAAEEIDGKLTAAMVPVVVEVGRNVELPEPVVKTNSKGIEYRITHRRIVEDADLALAATLTLAHLLQAGVTHLAIERVENPYVGEGGRGETMAIMRNIVITERLTTTIQLAAGRAGITVVPVTRATWTARLRKLIQAVTPDESPGKGDAVRGRGVALGHVLREHINRWPTGGADNENTRDAGGIVLWQALPAATAWKRPPGAPRTKRTRREGDGGSRQARRDKAQRAADRAAAGCVCVFAPNGSRHAHGCPLGIVPKTLVVSDACACPVRCSYLGEECPGRRAARRAK